MRLSLIVICDNCSSESNLFPRLSASYLGREKETSTVESASDPPSNKVALNHQMVGSTGCDVVNDSKHFTESNLTVNPSTFFSES